MKVLVTVFNHRNQELIFNLRNRLNSISQLKLLFTFGYNLDFIISVPNSFCTFNISLIN